MGIPIIYTIFANNFVTKNFANEYTSVEKVRGWSGKITRFFVMDAHILIEKLYL